MIEHQHPKLSVRKQSKLLKVNRNRLDPAKPKTTPHGLVTFSLVSATDAVDLRGGTCPEPLGGALTWFAEGCGGASHRENVIITHAGHKKAALH